LVADVPGSGSGGKCLGNGGPKVPPPRGGVTRSEGGGGDGLASMVERFTTAADGVDEVETGWTKQHSGGLGWTAQTKNPPLPR